MDKNRLFWGSRRGMLELDLILLPFVEQIYPTLPQEDKERYHLLLEEQDQDLFAWLMNRNDPQDAELLTIVQLIRDTRSQVKLYQ